MGAGKKVKFWEHVWCGDVRLGDAYSAVFQLAVDGEATMADYSRLDGEPVWWDIVLWLEYRSIGLRVTGNVGPFGKTI